MIMNFWNECQQNLKNKNTSGFSMMEILLVLFITVILAGIGFSFYFTEQRTVMTLRNATQEIVAYLYFAQNKAMIQEERSAWGVRFENPLSGSDFYALYIGDSFLSSRETKHLPSMIEYVTPATGSVVDVTFQRLSGRLLADRQIIIRVLNTTSTATINITTGGLISHSINF